MQSLCVDSRATERTSPVQANYPGWGASDGCGDTTAGAHPVIELGRWNQLTASVKDTALTSLIQQVLDALKKATVESEKARKYLPEFFDKLHEDLVKNF